MSGLHPAVATYREITSACPVQCTGQLVTGEWFYFRYRFGRATLGIGGSQEQANYDEYAASPFILHGDAMQGCFDSDDERDEVFARLYELRAVTR